MKKTALFAAALFVFCAAVGSAFLLGMDSAKNAASDEFSISSKKIIIDAGHGGPDVGTSGTAQNTPEDEINLAIAQKLKSELESLNYEVIMTREEDAQMGGSKNADMAARRKMIQESGQAATVSIHQNFYESSSEVSGPQVFYAPGSEEGGKLAQEIQNSLNTWLEPNKLRSAAEGNYYIVKSGEAPAVIVECGFLSNAEDEKLLLQSQYQVKIAKAIAEGLENYLSAES